MDRAKLKNTQQLLLSAFPNLLKFIEDTIGRCQKIQQNKFYQLLKAESNSIQSNIILANFDIPPKLWLEIFETRKF